MIKLVKVSIKKIAVFTVISMLFWGCNGKEFYTVLITNASEEKTVSYEYDGNSDSLDVSETKQYEVKAYTQPPKNIADQNGVASLVMNTNGMTGEHTFYDAAPFDLNVINRLPVDITIKAGNFIDNNGSTELTIASNNESTGAKIYTQTPEFTSTSNYPVNIEWAIDKNEMSVIIR